MHDLRKRIFDPVQPNEIESNEIRRFDFGIKTPKDAIAGSTRVSAYVLYYVCEDVLGTCRYLRQDINIKIDIDR